MAVYKRCPSCYKDNGLFNRHCVKCKAILEGKYSVRVKDMDTGKWKTKVVPSLRPARDVEHKFTVGIIEGSLLPSKLTKSKRQTISFDAYLDFAILKILKSETFQPAPDGCYPVAVNYC